MTKKMLEEATEAEIQAELLRRRVTEYEEKKATRLAANKLVEKHKDALLELVPEHSRTSCSDTNKANADRGCVRCYLLDEAFWDPDFELTFQITHDRVLDPREKHNYEP